MAENWRVTRDNKSTEQLREELSHWQHEIWSHWMKYQFSSCIRNADGSMTIPKEKVDRWEHQIDTPYNELSNSEKERDREQVDKFIHIIK